MIDNVNLKFSLLFLTMFELLACQRPIVGSLYVFSLYRQTIYGSTLASEMEIKSVTKVSTNFCFRTTVNDIAGGYENWVSHQLTGWRHYHRYLVFRLAISRHAEERHMAKAFTSLYIELYRYVETYIFYTYAHQRTIEIQEGKSTRVSCLGQWSTSIQGNII